MTTFERFIEAIGNKEELEPFKFHLLDKPISLLDQHGHFHAGWAVAWVRKNYVPTDDHLVYAMCATPIGDEVGVTVLQQEAFKATCHDWRDHDARLLPWVQQWLLNVPRPLLIKGGYLAAKAKKPQFCDYCLTSLVRAARYLYRVSGSSTERRTCGRTECRQDARRDIAQKVGTGIWAVLETEIDPFS